MYIVGCFDLSPQNYFYKSLDNVEYYPETNFYFGGDGIDLDIVHNWLMFLDDF